MELSLSSSCVLDTLTSYWTHLRACVLTVKSHEPRAKQPHRLPEGVEISGLFSRRVSVAEAPLVDSAATTSVEPWGSQRFLKVAHLLDSVFFNFMKTCCYICHRLDGNIFRCFIGPRVMPARLSRSGRIATHIVLRASFIMGAQIDGALSLSIAPSPHLSARGRRSREVLSLHHHEAQ